MSLLSISDIEYLEETLRTWPGKLTPARIEISFDIETSDFIAQLMADQVHEPLVGRGCRIEDALIDLKRDLKAAVERRKRTGGRRKT